MALKQVQDGGEALHKQIFVQSDFEKATEFPFLNRKLLAFSRTSPVKSTPNEDSMVFIMLDENSGVLAVADGLGGHPGGENASALLVGTLLENISSSEPDTMRETILNSIDEVNALLLDQGNGSATTLCALEIQDKLVRPYSIGDSMILIMSQRGRIKFQNIAHSPVGYALEAGVMEEQEAIVHEERHIVSNVVGCSEMKIDIGPAISLSPRDRVIISSDGLSDNLLTQDIIDMARIGSLDKVGEALLNQCQSNMLSDSGHPDDLSFFILS